MVDDTTPEEESTVLKSRTDYVDQTTSDIKSLSGLAYTSETTPSALVNGSVIKDVSFKEGALSAAYQSEPGYEMLTLCEFRDIIFIYTIGMTN